MFALSALKGSHSYTLTSHTHTHIHPHNAHRYPHTHSPSHVLTHPLTPTGLKLHGQPSTQPTPGPQPHTENFFFAVLPFPGVKPFMPCAARSFLLRRSDGGRCCAGRGDSRGKPEAGCIARSPAVGSPCCSSLAEAPRPVYQNPEALPVVKNSEKQVARSAL